MTVWKDTARLSSGLARTKGTIKSVDRDTKDGLGMWRVWVRRGVYRVLVGKPDY